MGAVRSIHGCRLARGSHACYNVTGGSIGQHWFTDTGQYRTTGIHLKERAIYAEQNDWLSSESIEGVF